MAIPRVSSVLETSLYVADLDRACNFYQHIFGFERFVHDGRMCALGVPGSQILLLFHHGATNQPAPVPGGFIPPHHGRGELHLCFAIPLGELATVPGHCHYYIYTREGVPRHSRWVTTIRQNQPLFFNASPFPSRTCSHAIAPA